MEEDVLGTMRTISQPTYVECSRCGTMTPRRRIHVVPSDALDALSEFEQLCDSCYTALVRGETELPVPEP